MSCGQFQFVMWIDGGERAWDVKEGWGKPTHSALEYGPCVCRTCYWALFTPSGPAAAAAFLGGTGRTGPFHSTSRPFRSNVQGEQFSSRGIYVQVECMHIPLHSLCSWWKILDGTQSRIPENYFPKKLALYSWLNTLRKLSTNKINKIKSHFLGLKFAKFVRKI